jgi:hypothetical protein
MPLFNQILPPAFARPAEEPRLLECATDRFRAAGKTIFIRAVKAFFRKIGLLFF